MHESASSRMEDGSTEDLNKKPMDINTKNATGPALSEAHQNQNDLGDQPQLLRQQVKAE